MAVCSRCIIPDSFPGIRLENNVCSFCRDQEKHTTMPAPAAEPLEAIIPRDSGPGRYDCLVPVSGGRDCSFILYYLVRLLGRKPFAVFFDSGLSHPQARKNIYTVCRKLGVEWATVRPPHHFQRKAAIEAMHISKAAGRFFGVCMVCENNLRTAALNQARELGISCIVWGSTDYEDTLDRYRDKLPATTTFRQRFSNGLLKEDMEFLVSSASPLLRSFHHTARFAYYLVRDNFDIRAPGGLKRLNPLYQVPGNRNGKIQAVYFFHHVPYHPELQARTLRQELEWEPLTGNDTRIDCRLHCFENYNMLSRTGITSDGFVMANLVRAGLMDRETALKQEASIRETIVHDCRETLRVLGFFNYPLLGSGSAITPIAPKMQKI